MRYYLITALLLCMVCSTKGQMINVGFEPVTGYGYTITNDTNNLWQICIPAKMRFTSAYSGNYAIMTDSSNLTAPSTNSMFEISFENSGCFNLHLSFNHKYFTDSLHSGGYVEVSYDKGATWTNIIYDTLLMDMYYNNFYGLTDTITGGMPSFTGNCDVWKVSSLSVSRHNICGSSDSIKYRFIFKSDSSAIPHEGWMIDDITLIINHCGSIKKINKKAESCFLYENKNNLVTIIPKDDCIIKITSLSGQSIYSSNKLKNEKINIDTKEWRKGYYLVSMINGKSTCSKLIGIGLW